MSVFSQFLTENEIEIILVFFDKRSFQLSVQIVGDIDSYIDVNYVRESHRKEYPVRSRSGSRRRELSVAGWLYDSIERTREVARATANVTHNLPDVSRATNVLPKFNCWPPFRYLNKFVVKTKCLILALKWLNEH